MADVIETTFLGSRFQRPHVGLYRSPPSSHSTRPFDLDPKGKAHNGLDDGEVGPCPAQELHVCFGYTII